MEDMPTGLMRRGARYSLRRRVPVDLVEHFGREEVTRALGTADPKEARKLLPLRWAELDREFEEVRANRAANNDQSETPLSEISPTLISLINLDTLRAERDQAAREGHLKEFNDQRRELSPSSAGRGHGALSSAGVQAAAPACFLEVAGKAGKRGAGRWFGSCRASGPSGTANPLSAAVFRWPGWGDF